MSNSKLIIRQIGLAIFILHSIYANLVQEVTTHRKSNGTLLRIVTSRVMDIDDIAGWKGQENWFYVTLNGFSLEPTFMDYLVFEPPVSDLEVSKNNESVQLGFLFDQSIEDFEIFHSRASRVLLIQVWNILSDSLRSEVKVSENRNQNRAFSLPKDESKGSPFYDSWVYARDKYGPTKYFVWYDKWYSTDGDEKNPGDEPKPLKLKELPLDEKSKFRSYAPSFQQTDDFPHLSEILDLGMLSHGIYRPNDIKVLQKALLELGYDLGSSGVYGNGVDGEFGWNTERAVMNFQSDRGFSGDSIDGVMGPATLSQLTAMLDMGNHPPKDAKKEDTVVNKSTTKQTALIEKNRMPILAKTERRETKKLNNKNSTTKYKTLNLSNRKTFIRLACDLDDANVFIDGNHIGQTPIPEKLSISPGWHRVRIIDPNSPPIIYDIPVPDYQDVYIPQGRTQHIRFNIAKTDLGSVD